MSLLPDVLHAIALCLYEGTLNQVANIVLWMNTKLDPVQQSIASPSTRTTWAYVAY